MISPHLSKPFMSIRYTHPIDELVVEKHSVTNTNTQTSLTDHQHEPVFCSSMLCQIVFLSDLVVNLSLVIFLLIMNSWFFSPHLRFTCLSSQSIPNINLTSFVVTLILWAPKLKLWFLFSNCFLIFTASTSNFWH